MDVDDHLGYQAFLDKSEPWYPQRETNIVYDSVRDVLANRPQGRDEGRIGRLSGELGMMVFVLQCTIIDHELTTKYR